MRKLRRKIVFAAFIATTIVFLLTILCVGIVLHINNAQRADAITEMIDNNDGDIPLRNSKPEDQPVRFDGETPYRVRFFTVFYDGDTVSSINRSRIATVDEAQAEQLAQSVRLNSERTGYYEDFRFRISDDGSRVIFVDYSDELASTNTLLLTLALVAVAFVVLITLVFYLLAERVVRPFEENSRMQKQFITDASHELKTPLAIISANAEVLAYKNGSNEWTQNITAQVARISALINELLTLNRLEEIETNVDIRPVDMSQTVLQVVGEFEENFRSKGVQVEYAVAPEVRLSGNPEQLRQLVAVLVENAAKYVTENGIFRIELQNQLRSTVLTTFNSCAPTEDVEHLFERFYRPDAARSSKTGGHGIGLSIAKRIVTLHNGTIQAIPQADGLLFRATLSNRLKPDKTVFKRTGAKR